VKSTHNLYISESETRKGNGKETWFLQAMEGEEIQRSRGDGF